MEIDNTELSTKLVGEFNIYNILATYSVALELGQDKQKVLADVVWIIREFKPDIIITRFPPTSKAGHGHHSASTILAEEAFELAANPKAFSEQLKYTTIWQPKRLFLNASTWWDKELPQILDFNTVS